jgi:hypothetical protein
MGVITILASLFLYKSIHSSVKNDENFWLKAANNKYVSVDKAHNNILIADKDSMSLWETFSMCSLKNNKHAIYSHESKYLSAELGDKNEITATRDKIADWETFTIVELDNNHVALKAANGKYLSVDNESLQLYARSDSIHNNEKFKIVTRKP